MKKAPPISPDARALRRRAEQKLQKLKLGAKPPQSEMDARVLVHELQVHQIELETQNAELQRAQDEAQQAADNYTDLFDFAPVGYFVLDALGVIREVNLSGAALLGLDRQRVTGQCFEQHLAPDCRVKFTVFCQSVRPDEGRRSCETRLVRQGQDPYDVLVEATWFEAEPAAGHGYRLAVTNITERKRAEEQVQQFNVELERRIAERTAELCQANERYELVLAGAGGGIWDWDVPRHKVMFSSRWKAMRGFADPEISDAEAEWSQRIHPEDASRVKAAVQAHFEGKTSFFAEEYRVRHKDGSWMWVAARGLARRDADGRVVRMAGSEVDITERKRAEEALRQLNAELQAANENLSASIQAALHHRDDALASRQRAEQISAERQQAEQAARTAVDRYQSFLELTGQVGWTTDANGLVTEDMPAWRAFTGQSAEEIQGWGWAKAVHSEDLERTSQVWQAAVQGRTDYETDYRLRRHDGVYREFLARGVPNFHDDGSIREWVGTCIDITERKLSEQALRESESFYRQTLESIPGMVFTTRPDGYCDYQSLQWVEFTGVPISEHLGDGWNKLLHSDDRPRAFAAWREAVEGRAPYDLEYRVRRHDGQYEWFKVRGRPIRDAAGQIVRWFGTALNIEDLKRAEEHLKASLREQEVLLQEIHHRVKNNLQVISSLINLQADTLDQPALRTALNDMRDRVRTMALVHEKLYQSNDLACLNFADYAASLLHYLWRAHGETGSKVKLTMATQPVALPVNLAVPCGLILNELASNALKHAFHDRPAGEVTVGLTHDAVTGQVRLRVSDNGSGLPAGLDWRQSRSLGLRLVLMLAQQLRGSVEAGSGPGTEFRVTFAVPEGA